MTENIRVFTQNSIRIDTGAGRIYIDPFKMEEDAKDADIILVTHDHYDHFSPEDIAKVSKPDTILVVPEKMAKKAEEVSDLVAEIRTVSQTGSIEVSGLTIETIPAYNIMKPFHPKKDGCVSYILCTEEGRIYIAGDTDATDEAKAVRCDIALVPIGGTFTMDAKKAAELINIISPKVAIPVHYGGSVGSPKDGETFAKLVNDPVRVELKIER